MPRSLRETCTLLSEVRIEARESLQTLCELAGVNEEELVAMAAERSFADMGRATWIDGFLAGAMWRAENPNT